MWEVGGGVSQRRTSMKNQKGVEDSGKERAGEVVEDRYAPRQLD